MKSVSTAFKNAINKNYAKSYQEVFYKRRYWNGSAYVWESSYTQLDGSEIASITPITGKLDTEKLNEFKISNVTLVLKNSDNRLAQANPGGIFGGDTVSPGGYEAYWTKFQIKFGVILADGSAESIPVFTGVATEFTPFTDDLTMQVRVDGLESLLSNASAENVSTRVVQEVIGTGDATTTEFVTALPGVGIIEYVSVDGITATAGVEYDVSDLNEPTKGAKITFSFAPLSGTTIGITYRYWKQSQRIEDLVSDLLTEAGIPEVDQDIDSVLFPTTIKNTKTETIQVDFLAGTNTTIDLTTEADSILIDFNDSSQKQLLDDMSDISDWTLYNADTTVDSGRMKMDRSGAKRASTKVEGVWQIDYQFGSVSSAATMRFAFMANTVDFPVSGGPLPKEGYLVLVGPVGIGYGTELCRCNSDGSISALGQYNTAGPTGDGCDTSAHTLRISRTPAGRIRVYLDGTLRIDATDNAYTVSNYISLGHTSAAGSPLYIYFDNLYDPKDTLTGTHQSETIDCLETPIAWGRLLRNFQLNGGALTYYTRSSANGSSWDSWVESTSNLQIGSDLKRYLEVKVEFTAASTANNNPKILDYAVEYRNTIALVRLANFTGKTCYDAVQDLGKFANYEWGFDADETFFFRSKSVSTSVDQTLDYRYNLSTLESLGTGYDLTYSEVQAKYGAFDVTLKDDGKSMTGPGARFAKRRLTVDGGDTLVAADADIASGIASSFLNYYGQPRRRFKARCKLLPQVDLSDTVTVTFLDGLSTRPWFHGDTSASLGDNDLQHFGTSSMIADGLLCKVVGYRHDKQNETSELDLEEILT